MTSAKAGKTASQMVMIMINFVALFEMSSISPKIHLRSLVIHA